MRIFSLSRIQDRASFFLLTYAVNSDQPLVDFFVIINLNNVNHNYFNNPKNYNTDAMVFPAYNNM